MSEAPSGTETREFLVKEYETARDLTFHVDDLRARLTGFFITLAGIAVAGLSLLVKSEQSGQDVSFATGIATAGFIAVAGIGAVIVGILARLRRVQIEHFQIMSNVRAYFFRDDLDLWNAARLSSETVPEPTRRSGSYLWMLAVAGLSSFMLGAGLFLLLNRVFPWASYGWALVWSCIAASVALAALDRLYFSLVRAVPFEAYRATPR